MRKNMDDYTRMKESDPNKSLSALARSAMYTTHQIDTYLLLNQRQ